MEKPNTQKEIVLKIWQMLAGVNDDGLYYEVKRLMHLVDEFIKNSGNVRSESCPIKNQFDAHLLEQETTKKNLKDNKDFKLKKWQVAFAGFGVCVAITLGVLNLIL